MDNENRRLRKFILTNKLLIKLLNGILSHKLPKDSLIVEIGVNHEHDAISFIIHSDQFEPLQEGESVL